ncbi:MAG: biotin-dependent carboxyltransferase family protein [Sulfuritalea sp.]|nr:biotin-dependent carboxyltransferase family protein [Sulfuritalea sp.]
MIKVLTCHGAATVQDLGRPGFRHLGVPLSGALDGGLLQIANALVGNRPDAAAIELRLVGPRLQVDAPLRIAFAGAVDGRIESTNGSTRNARAWTSHQLLAGDTLSLGPLRSGVAYLAIAGGIDVPQVLGSRSTYTRAHFGGYKGRQLAAGDRLAAMSIDQKLMRSGIQQDDDGGTENRELRLPDPPHIDPSPLRVLAGPQQEHFTAQARQRLIEETFIVSPQADRMGLRLAGSRLDHDPQYGADIISDGVTPGTIQVPADGQPIVLLADCQTIGGYPKIATVISADLPRLGHVLPGQKLRFVEVSIQQAADARLHAAKCLAESIARICPDNSEFDLDALYTANLIDGVIDAQQAN